MTEHFDAARGDEIDAVGSVALADDALTGRGGFRAEKQEKLFALVGFDGGEDREPVEELLLLQRPRRLARLVALCAEPEAVRQPLQLDVAESRTHCGTEGDRAKPLR